MSLIVRGDLQALREQWRRGDKRVVLTNGCYDLLHVGHLRTFRRAKEYGDILVVGVNSDRSVRTLKGESRPLIGQDDRSELVAALAPVDFAVIFDELTVDGLLEQVHPRVYVKGGDYTLDTLPEKQTLLRLGIEARFVPIVAGNSTSALLEKIQAMSRPT